MDVADTDVQGELPALLNLMVANRTDKDGSAAGTPDAWSNRVLVGLRTLSRGDEFTPYLNISDQQRLDGITFYYAAGFANDINSPTYRSASWTGNNTSFTSQIYGPIS